MVRMTIQRGRRAVLDPNTTGGCQEFFDAVASIGRVECTVIKRHESTGLVTVLLPRGIRLLHLSYPSGCPRYHPFDGHDMLYVHPVHLRFIN